MNWTAVVITVIICATLLLLGRKGKKSHFTTTAA